MNPNKYKFEAMLWRLPGSFASYVIFPGDIKKIFGKSIVYVHATIDGEPLDCCIRSRGHKHFKDRPAYTISLRREMLDRIDKTYGETVTVTVRERERETAER
ncbi:MAG: DUF1905 domain-containing protein [Firmicutes bacterium]|nr:DUF1905 domain-containing protein [Bacillota bacterium]